MRTRSKSFPGFGNAPRILSSPHGRQRGCTLPRESVRWGCSGVNRSGSAAVVAFQEPLLRTACGRNP
ncbi:MAG: hypothetical protein PVI71_01695 [Desulfobacterales bacterium]